MVIEMGSIIKWLYENRVPLLTHFNNPNQANFGNRSHDTWWILTCAVMEITEPICRVTEKRQGRKMVMNQQRIDLEASCAHVLI